GFVFITRSASCPTGNLNYQHHPKQETSTVIAATFLSLALLFPFAQQPPQQRPQGPPSGQPATGQAEAPKPAPTPPPDEPPVVTKHEIKAGGKALKYTVTTGFMPIKNNQGETEARMFFIAYTLDGQGNPAQRPMMFSFNGGLPAPPYRLVDNEYTWLDKTDMVFIDPVGTGYSRATNPANANRFFGLEGDLSSVGEFIRMYLTRYERWSSPLFLVGES